MREKFVNGFITKLCGDVPDEYLDVIKNKLSLYANDFDITKRETSIAKYTGYLPDFYKTYFVSRKIEGLSRKTLQLYNLYLDDFFFTVNKKAEDITSNDIRVYLYTVQQERNLILKGEDYENQSRAGRLLFLYKIAPAQHRRKRE